MWSTGRLGDFSLRLQAATERLGVGRVLCGIADLHMPGLGLPSLVMAGDITRSESSSGIRPIDRQSCAPVLEMRAITVTFKRVVALDRADFTVNEAEVVALIGNSGAGKSTLIKALVGLLPVAEGQIFLDGRHTVFASPQEARRSGIETVYQDLALLDELTIARNFFLGCEPLLMRWPLHPLSHRQMVSRTEEVFHALGMTDMPSPRRLVSQLSGGQRQMLAIARALHFGRRVILLDEPTAALSDNHVELILAQIERARARGLGVVFVTHKAHEVFSVADRFVVLDRGRSLISVPRGQTSLNELEKLLISSRFTMVQEMAAAVAHQFRNPLGILRVSAEMLRDDFEVSDRREQYDKLLIMIIDELGTLETLITNYLDFARQRQLRCVRVSVAALVEDAVAQVSDSSVERSRLMVDIPQQLPAVFVDEDLMQQVLVNLITNAAEASEPDQPVAITAGGDASGGVWMSVQDFGRGMDERTRKMVFNPFFSTKTRGTGLGLSIVHRIVEQHGGRIEVLSEVEQGTTFIVSLPAEEQ